MRFFCEYCGKVVHRTPHDYNSHEHHFCSRNCHGKYSAMMHQEELKKRGENNL